MGHKGESLNLSVIFSTYNSPQWLQKVLWGLLAQSFSQFEVIVADDGSADETRAVIDSMRPEFTNKQISVRHVWQRDDGFRKCRILNKAILHAVNDYLVFTDGDCILRQDFLQVHASRSAQGNYLSGSYYKLPMGISKVIDRADIDSARCFNYQWLRNNGLPASASRLKLISNSSIARCLNRLTPTRANLKGANASVWRKDLLSAGGFDEQLQWGGLDRELGVRLQNAGITPRLVKYDAICIHLDHARGYKQADRVAANLSLRKRVEKDRITHTEFGTDRLLAEGYSTDQARNYTDE